MGSGIRVDNQPRQTSPYSESHLGVGGAKPYKPQPAQARRRGYEVIALLVVVFWTLSCQPAPPVATPTATRTPILPTATPTPIPTSTPTATPTMTPTPTPTLPPGLIVGSEAVMTDSCPPSQAELFFLREGALWVCPAEGGLPQRAAAAIPEGDSPIVWYEVSEDGRYTTLLNAEGRVSLLERSMDRLTVIPTAGRIIDAQGQYLSLVDETGAIADGATDQRTLIYLAWGVQLDPGPATSDAHTDPLSHSGVIFAVNALSPTLRQQPLTACVGAPEHPCGGFIISPDRSQIATVDGIGIRQVDRAQAQNDVSDNETAQTYIGLVSEETPHLHSWSPDGQWLLLTPQQTTESDQPAPAFTLLSVDAAQSPIRFEPLCPTPCSAEVSWARSSEGALLWLTWKTEAQGCIAALNVADLTAEMVTIAPENRICEVQSVMLRPASPLGRRAISALSGTVAFLQDAGPGIAAGIYALDAQATLLGVALLPERPHSVLWSAFGDTFLTLDAAGRALRLGSLRTTTLWHVETLLSGAEAFQWHSVLIE